MLTLPDFKEKILIIVFSNDGEKLLLKNENLLVKDKDDNIKLQVSCYNILAIWVLGSFSITSGLLQKSKKFAFPILVLSYNFKCVGVWNSPAEGNFLLRKQQYFYELLDIAKLLVENKIENQIKLLQNLREKNDSTYEVISSLKKYQSLIYENHNLTLEELLGIEGISSRIYFKEWFGNYGWIRRSPRTKIDIINLLLDMGYTYIFYFIENMLNLYGFDLYKGVYHQLFFQRKSLVCDLQEPFRCLIDYQIKKSFNLKQIDINDFVKTSNGFYCLKDFNLSKKYLKIFTNIIIDRKEDIFLYCQNYYRSFIRGKDVKHFPKFYV